MLRRWAWRMQTDFFQILIRKRISDTNTSQIKHNEGKKRNIMQKYFKILLQIIHQLWIYQMSQVYQKALNSFWAEIHSWISFVKIRTWFREGTQIFLVTEEINYPVYICQIFYLEIQSYLFWPLNLVSGHLHLLILISENQYVKIYLFC